MAAQWVLASVTVALVAAGAGGAVLVTSGPLNDDSQSETLQQPPPVGGELTRQRDPEGTASDSETQRARELALANPEIADWLSSHGDWNLLWVDLYDISGSKDQSCSPGPCVEVVFYSWKAARTLTAVVDLESGHTLASPVELRAPRLTQQLKEESGPRRAITSINLRIYRRTTIGETTPPESNSHWLLPSSAPGPTTMLCVTTGRNWTRAFLLSVPGRTASP